MIVLLHCFKMDKKLNTPGTKIGEFYGKSGGAKIQISVNSKNLKEAFQKLTDIFNESISKKNDMIKSLKDKLQEQYNEFDEKIKALKKKCNETMSKERKEHVNKIDEMMREYDEMMENLSKEHDYRYNSLQKMYDDTLAIRELDQQRLFTYKQKYIEINNHYNEVNYNNAEMSKKNLELEKNNKFMKEEITNARLEHAILRERFDELTQTHQRTCLLLELEQDQKSELKVDIEKLRVDIERYNGKIEILKTNVATLEKEKKSLSKEKKKDKDKIIKLESKQDQRDCSIDLGFKALQSQAKEAENKLEEMTEMRNQWREKCNNVNILYKRLKEQMS